MANIVSFGWLGFGKDSYLGNAIRFFIYDTIKIGVLLVFINYIMAVTRYYFPLEKARDILSKNRWFGMNIHFYPRICPAAIVAVVRDGKILLAHARRFPSVFFSVLAGFVEAGETFEECVRRELREEAGIEVKNIRYFGSQPWPFPNTLMVGFTAEYAGGELVIEEKELVQAAWFEPREVLRLQIPRNGTIARRLIDWFLEEYGNPGERG